MIHPPSNSRPPTNRNCFTFSPSASSELLPPIPAAFIHASACLLRCFLAIVLLFIVAPQSRATPLSPKKEARQNSAAHQSWPRDLQLPSALQLNRFSSRAKHLFVWPISGFPVAFGGRRDFIITSRQTTIHHHHHFHHGSAVCSHSNSICSVTMRFRELHSTCSPVCMRHNAKIALYVSSHALDKYGGIPNPSLYTDLTFCEQSFYFSCRI